MPIFPRSPEGTEVGPQRHLWGLPARPQTQQSDSKTQVLLADINADAINYAKQCHTCQIHKDFIHQALGHLHSMTASWQFEAWGKDVVRPINPLSSKGHCFILAIIDYVSNWSEVVFLKEVKAFDMVQFVKHHVIYRFGVPRCIFHDNIPQFIGLTFQRFSNKFSIQSIASMAYYLPTNGHVASFNKTIRKLLNKFIF